MSKLSKFRIFFNLTGIIIIFIFIYFLVQKDLVLNGKLTVESNLTDLNPMISVLFPEHRVQKENNHYLIKDEPVYFTVRSPIKFDQAEVEVEFKTKNQNIIGLGVATTKEGWNFENHTLYNKTLNDINWPSISDGVNTLYQKEKKFNTIAEFMKVSNTLEGVGAYDFDLGGKFILHDYQARNKKISITNCLRGQHSFYTYIKNEALNFDFKIQDINRTNGEDPLVISVYNAQDKKIYSKMVSDDGFVSNRDPASKARYISLYLPNLTEGVYKIDLSANDDIFIREISTTQQKIVFIDRLYLCDSSEYIDGFTDLNLNATQVYTNGRIISFYTAHNAGLQTINLDNKAVNIYQKHKWIKVATSPKLSTIYVPKNDLKISSRGIFALNKDNYFNPEIINLQDYSNTEEVNYIIARYQKPKQLANSWLKNKIRFNLNKAKIENGNLKFMISSPDLKATDDDFKINSLKIKLSTNQIIDQRSAQNKLWQEIITKIKKLINNIKQNEQNN